MSKGDAKRHAPGTRIYGDWQAAEELRSELKAYARDKESAAVSALDWAIFFFNRQNRKDIAQLLMKEKAEYLSCELHALKIVDLKSALQYVVLKLFEMDFNGCAITLENRVVEWFGELDDTHAKNKNEKRAIEHEQARRASEYAERGVHELKKGRGDIIYPKIEPTKSGNKIGGQNETKDE